MQDIVGIDFEEESIITSQQRILAWGEDDDENENPNQLKLDF